MTQIAILNGIYSDAGPDLRTSYPINMIPVPKGNGISNGYLRPADGIVSIGTGPGIGRGGINWNGDCYRVMGTKLVKINAAGAVAILGDVGGSGHVSMDYSFDRLAIAADNRLYYWDGGILTQVTDPDLGAVVDVKWIAGYFMTTDGTSLVVTELTDPMAVNPLKYGSSEADPDPVKALIRLRNEIYALNRYTIEAFDNVGGDFFPFARIEGAQITKGTVGTHACCVYQDGIAFVGSGRNEAPGVYVGVNAGAIKISTRELDTILMGFTDEQLESVILESRNDKANQYLYIHMPDRTMVYDVAASKEANEPVWLTLVSSTDGFSQFTARDFVWANGEWTVTHPTTSAFGRMTDQTGHHWGQKVRWEFGTAITYNGGKGAIFHELELVALSGRVEFGKNPQISTSYSVDGETWSQDKFISAGLIGDRAKRLVWRQQGFMRNWRIQRFRGDSDSHLAFMRLEAQLEPLAV